MYFVLARLVEIGMTWDLIADIGGTNTRLARVEQQKIVDRRSFPTDQESGVLAALRAYQAFEAPPNSCTLAVAGRVQGDCVRMTNSEQVLRCDDIRSITGTRRVRLLNDFEAAAWSLVSLSPKDAIRIKGNAKLQPGNRVIIGPGTGLGVSVLAQSNGHHFVLPSEGGHISVAPTSDFEVEVFRAYRNIRPDLFFGDTLAVEVEAIASGMGLPFLHYAVCMAMGVEVCHRTAEKIMQCKGEETVDATLEIFSSHLGRTAGDFAISATAYGGVFIYGGVAQKNSWLFDGSFCEAFDSGGRFRSQREEINVFLCLKHDAGLEGALNASRSLAKLD